MLSKNERRRRRERKFAAILANGPAPIFDKNSQTSQTTQINQNPPVPSKPNAYIGVYLQRFETQEPFCASDRIRGEWIIKSSDKIELFNPNKNYEVVIFHLPTKAIAKYGRIKILDICDKVWERDLVEFKTLIEPIDAIIVPTEKLKSDLSEITDKPIHVIRDGHDFSSYSRRIRNMHINPAKEIVWFGYAENAAPLQPFVNYIKSLGLKLKVISQNQNTSPLQFADEFVKFDPSTYVQEISKSDFAILPLNKDYKSNNKDITALLCGIPVAKTKEDIARLIIPGERSFEMDATRNEAAKYDAREVAQEYIKIASSIKKVDIVQIYSSICGNFDKPRNDIQIFTDLPSDRFRLPVMNAKIYKILPHTYFSSQFSIYMDGNIFPLEDPLQMLQDLLKTADIAVFRHPFRKCLYEEHLPARLRVTQPYQGLMDEQIRRYRQEGMPEMFGLAECGMIIRRHNKDTEEFNNRWWAEICRYTNRDQISFPYVMWKMKDRIKVNFIEGNVRKHPYFKYVNHG